MKALWPTVNPLSPSVARKARRYESKLRRALALAAKKDSRLNTTLAALYKGAQVEGISLRLRMKKATITFSDPPFRGGLHQSYDWATLDGLSVPDLAASLAWSLRASLRDARRRRSSNNRFERSREG